MPKKLEGKIALVTGGSSVIGLATAQRFVAEGAYVFITGRRLAEMEKAIETMGSNVTGVQGDAGSLSDLDNLYDRIKQEKGRLDIIFANAGGGAFAPLGSITEEHYTSTFDSNVKGLIFTVQKALSLLADGSSIILNASITTVKGLPSFSVYSASKAAVRSFARTWTMDLRERKIRVNAISPGATETPGWLGLAETEEQKKAMFAQVAATVPLGRIAQPVDIAYRRASNYLSAGMLYLRANPLPMHNAAVPFAGDTGVEFSNHTRAVNRQKRKVSRKAVEWMLPKPETTFSTPPHPRARKRQIIHAAKCL